GSFTVEIAESLVDRETYCSVRADTPLGQIREDLVPQRLLRWQQLAVAGQHDHAEATFSRAERLEHFDTGAVAEMEIEQQDLQVPIGFENGDRFGGRACL